MWRLRLVLWVLVALSALGAGGLYLSGAWQQRAASLRPDVTLDVPFTLAAHDGRVLRQTDFRSKPTAWFFGFTHCPDVCPTALMHMTDLLGRLGTDGDRLNVVFVSVDPERDTQQVMNDYLSAFDPRIVGVMGPQAEIEKLAKGYFIHFARVPLQDGGYTMGHTASILLTDSAGRLKGTLDYHESADVSLAKLKRLVGGAS